MFDRRAEFEKIEELLNPVQPCHDSVYMGSRCFG